MIIHFWQRTLSIHQSPLINQLAKCERVEKIYLHIEKRITEERISCGWSIPSFRENVVLFIGNDDEFYKDSISDWFNDYHVLSGLFNSKFGRFLKYHLSSMSHFYIQTESAARSNRFLNRLVKYIYRAKLMPHSQYVKGVFAIGEDCKNWLVNDLGLNEKKVYSFGYFVDAATFSSTPVYSGGSVRLLFVGRLEKVKGIYPFAKRLVDKQLNCSLTVIGSGSQQGLLESLASTSPNIKIVGSVPNSQLKEYFAVHDVLVLPNVGEEGWGVVVNEALAAGLLVMCTHLTGAKALVKNSGFGIVAERGNYDSFFEFLSNFDRVKKNLDRFEIREWSETYVSAHVAAEYVVAVFRSNGIDVSRYGWLAQDAS